MIIDPHHRESHDRQIRADELEVGDELHLTFIGGNEYCEVLLLHLSETNGQIEWEADSVGGVIKDDIAPDTKVWIKK